MQKIKSFAFVGILSILFLGCQSSKPFKSVEAAEHEFQSLIDEMVSSNIHLIQGASLSVYAPNLGINWSGVSGISDVKEKTPLTTDQPFRIASVTKTFVVAAILILHERGDLSIDDPISKYVSQPHLDLLKKGGYFPDKISIKHCLNHTSGLFLNNNAQGASSSARSSSS